MPRIHPRTILRAHTINKVLPRLLPVCRDLASARNELRWLREHAANVAERTGQSNRVHDILAACIQRRIGAEPLQYILGSEYCGDLKIRCRPGVLIPRPETAASVSHLVSLFHQGVCGSLSSPLRVLDLCTGSGCTPLLFHHEFYKNDDRTSELEIVGIDISPDALSLARENLVQQIAAQRISRHKVSQAARSLQRIGFVQANILHDGADEAKENAPSLSEALQRLGSDISLTFDILISNPPYISPQNFWTTPRSVRHHEPRIALVPPRSEGADDQTTADRFYPRLLQVAEQINAKIALFEVSDLDQAMRVASLAAKQRIWSSIEVWRDDPRGASPATDTTLDGQTIKLRGFGEGRSVFLCREDATAWIDILP